MSVGKRKVYSAGFKARVGLEAIRGMKTVNKIAQEHGVHPSQVAQWKRAIQEQAGTLFEGKRGPQPVDTQSDPEHLYSEIGRLKVELDWLKKVRTWAVAARRSWVAPDKRIPLSQQCVYWQEWPGQRSTPHVSLVKPAEISPTAMLDKMPIGSEKLGLSAISQLFADQFCFELYA